MINVLIYGYNKPFENIIGGQTCINAMKAEIIIEESGKAAFF